MMTKKKKQNARFSKDISRFSSTIGNALKTNRERWIAAKTVEELYEIVKKLFIDADIDTPKSRLMLAKLKNMNLINGLTFVQNTLFASMGLATY